MDVETARVVSAAIGDPYSRCAICGVPNRILAALHRIGHPVPIPRRNKERLTVDHIAPGGPSIIGNIRLLCGGCNSLRGADKYSDGAVLARMRKRWEKALPAVHLWWLNLGPGWGGAPFRGKKHQQQEESVDSLSDRSGQSPE